MSFFQGEETSTKDCHSSSSTFADENHHNSTTNESIAGNILFTSQMSTTQTHGTSDTSPPKPPSYQLDAYSTAIETPKFMAPSDSSLGEVDEEISAESGAATGQYWLDFLAGTSAGVSICLVGHPFDTVKVRLQTQPIGSEKLFQNGIECAFKTVRYEGFFALYKGMGSPLSTVPIVNAIVFASYEQGKRMASNTHWPLSWQICFAGTFAGFINSIVVSPVELIKSKLQIQYTNKGSSRLYNGPLHCMKTIVQVNGVHGLFRGMVPTLLREVPAYAAQFYTYEKLKEFFSDGGEREISSPKLMLSGGLAGIAAWSASYPQDVVKCRIQVQPDNVLQFRHRFFDGGFIECWKDTVRRESWRGLWKGFATCTARALPANAAGFLTYEYVSEFLKAKEGNEN